MNQENRIIITHCVDPNRFYFKYVNDCVNDEYSSFDYVVQCYGNGLYDRKLLNNNPEKNDVIIFFDLILNKWLRGRVTNTDDNVITLWCIDNGIFRTSEKQFIQPLTENLKREFNLVHLGGLSVLPAESKLNFATLNVKMQVSHSWDNDMKNNFKMIIDSAKRISFIEEIQFGNVKLGSLLTETKAGRVAVINEILLQMNKAISCSGSAEDMPTYISEKYSNESFYESFNGVSNTIQAKTASNASREFGVTHCKHSRPKTSLNEPGESGGVDVYLKPNTPERTSKSSGGSHGVELHLKPTEPNAPGELGISLHSNPFQTKEFLDVSVESSTELNLLPVKPKKTSIVSGKSETEELSVTEGSNGSKSVKKTTINDDNLNQKNEKPVSNSDIFFRKIEVDLSSPDESIDTFDNSATVIVSSICTLENQSSVMLEMDRNETKVTSVPCEYECHLKKFGKIQRQKIREPLQSSIDWINQLRVPVSSSAAEDNESCGSSIINLGDFSSVEKF